VLGESDARGENPKDKAITPDDIAATFYKTLGIDPAKEYKTPGGRPVMITPLWDADCGFGWCDGKLRRTSDERSPRMNGSRRETSEQRGLGSRYAGRIRRSAQIRALA